MAPSDWPAVSAIYAAGIATRNATFENTVPSWEEWDRRHLEAGRLVARVGGAVAGWAALSPTSGREVYRGVAELSLYVDPARARQGIGRALLQALIDTSEAAGIWTLQTGVFPENEASLALHAACGFRVVGTREKIGEMAGRWRDVVLLERRQPTA